VAGGALGLADEQLCDGGVVEAAIVQKAGLTFGVAEVALAFRHLFLRLRAAVRRKRFTDTDRFTEGAVRFAADERLSPFGAINSRRLVAFFLVGITCEGSLTFRIQTRSRAGETCARIDLAKSGGTEGRDT